MKILSIVWGSCATAALMADGEIVACVSEERFSRNKNDESYPKRAIEDVLRQAGVTPGELDVVAFAGERFDPQEILHRKCSGWSVHDRLREQREYWYPRIYERKDVCYLDVFKDKLDAAQYPGDWDDVIAALRNGHEGQQANTFFQTFRRRVVAQHLGIDPRIVVFPHHHRAHGFYAYYASSVSRKDRVLILTADAWGDDMNASVNLAEHGQIHRLHSSTNFNLARLYRYMTLLLGMKPDEHEYKVMGLAPYAKPEFFQDSLRVFRDTMYVEGLGFKYHTTPPDFYVYFQKRLEGHRFDAIAGALQRYTEEIVMDWTRNCLAETGARRLCFGGGLAMNVKAMMAVAQLDDVEELWVCPSPSDESLAMGACYVVMHDACLVKGVDPRTILRPLTDAYLGPDLDAQEVRRVIEQAAQNGCVIQERVNPAVIARLLIDGKIVGRCVGRSEFGARALGNRSILADPRRLDLVKVINEKVKSRDFWMPFAPSILEERASDYLVNPKRLAAPYMTVAFETTPRASRDLPAALHPADLTCRPQLISQAVNPDYHALLREFERLTDVGGVLNTSFNIHGEPIIQSAADALDVFQRSGLDVLVLDHYVVMKKDQPVQGGAT